MREKEKIRRRKDQKKKRSEEEKIRRRKDQKKKRSEEEKIKNLSRILKLTTVAN